MSDNPLERRSRPERDLGEAGKRTRHLPHERDERPEATPQPTRSIIHQAASDLERGLVDTDLHGLRGVETVTPTAPDPAGSKPRPGTRRD